MTRRMTLALGVIVVVLSALLPGYDASAQARGGFTTLLQGNTLKGWNIVGDANWEVVDGAVQATTGMAGTSSRRTRTATFS